MKTRPMLFSGPMVRALLAGTKTQTRLVMKPQPTYSGYTEPEAAKQFTMMVDIGVVRCPYGKPGDRLWVRETWMDLLGTGIERKTGDHGRYAYAADTPPGSYGDDQRKAYGLKWRPSIHMPRAASRITLEITGVRVERLQDISEADAKAEGADPFRLPVHPSMEERRHSSGFALLWEQINGPGSWDANPWVWVVEFRRAQP